MFLQLGHHVHYIACFFIGIIAYRKKWFDYLTKKNSKLWIILAVSTIILFPAVTALSGILTLGTEVFMGGFHWQAYEYAIWESIMCVSIIITICHIFKSKYSTQNFFLRTLSSDAYATFIFHVIVIVMLNIFLRELLIPTAVKFLIVSITGIPLCFIIAHIIRRIPYVKNII